MAELVGEDAGELVGAFGPVEQALHHEDLAARQRKRVRHRGRQHARRHGVVVEAGGVAQAVDELCEARPCPPHPRTRCGRRWSSPGPRQHRQCAVRPASAPAARAGRRRAARRTARRRRWRRRRPPTSRRSLRHRRRVVWCSSRRVQRAVTSAASEASRISSRASGGAEVAGEPQDAGRAVGTADVGIGPARNRRSPRPPRRSRARHRALSVTCRLRLDTPSKKIVGFADCAGASVDNVGHDLKIPRHRAHRQSLRQARWRARR